MKPKLKEGRKKALAIAQDDELNIRDKLDLLLDLGITLQSELDAYYEGGDEVPFFDVFGNPELINPEWSEKVRNPVTAQISDTNANESIIVYFIYKYFLQSVYDLDVLSKIKLAVIGVLINTYFGEDAWTLHLWSKETEHSQYNMDRYKRLLKEADSLSVSALKYRIRL